MATYKHRIGLHGVLTLAAALSAASALVGCDDATSSEEGDADDDVTLDADTGADDTRTDDADADPDVRVEPTFTDEVIVARQDAALEDAATGSLAEPSVVFGTIPVDGEYTHALSFQMTPMSPPLLRGDPSPGPLILYSDALDVIVVSPMDHVFEALVWFDNGAIGYGLHGDLESVPAGFEQRWLVVRGHGIGATIAHWGDVMRAAHGRERTDRYADVGVSTLGYWTDNGATYYYETADGLNEADTLLAVSRDARERGIPLGYMQLDSWWYHKEDGFPPGGLLDWSPQPAMFPDGLATFQAELDLPLIVHNRWFGRDNTYRDRYEFVDDTEMSFPVDLGVFGELMDSALDWGVVTYEQDWLMPQLSGVRWLRAGAGRAESWMQAIDTEAAARGLTVQITMPGPAHLLDAASRPATTSARTSIDYRAGVSKESFWPEFHTTNMIAWAMGVLPFKDNFHTSEPYGEAEALVSALSAGMVGIGDAIGASDAEIALRTCRSDGMLLKPDAPAIPIDAMFLPHERPYTTYTHTELAGVGVWTYVAAYHLASAHPDRTFNDRALAIVEYEDPLEQIFIYPADVSDWTVRADDELGVRGDFVVYDWRTGVVTEPGADGELELPRDDSHYGFAYVVLAPVLANGIALIGEPAKFVTMADRRVAGVAVGDSSIEVALRGAPGEVVELLAWDTVGERELRSTATIGADGTATATLGGE